jgi:hypothetical protein
MSNIFLYRGKIYSISDRNAFNEFVVVKLSLDRKDVLGAKIIPGKSEKQVEKLIKTFNFENFKDLPNEPIH